MQEGKGDNGRCEALEKRGWYPSVLFRAVSPMSRIVLGT